MGYLRNKYVHNVMIIPVLLSVIVVFVIVVFGNFLRINSVSREMLGVSSLLVLGVRLMAFLTHVLC